MGNLNYSDVEEVLSALSADDAASPLSDASINLISELVLQSILPRKLSAGEAYGGFELYLNKGAIAGFRASKTAEHVWIRDTVSLRLQTILHELLAMACRALESNALLISQMGNAEKTAMLEGANALPELPTPPVETTVNMVEQEIENSIIPDFCTALGSTALFTHCSNKATNEVKTSGAYSDVNGEFSTALSDEIAKWDKSVSNVLSNVPKMIVASNPGGKGTTLVCAGHGAQYLVAEINLHSLGTVVGLWNKATQQV